MAFVVDKGLEKLLAQINEAAPNRSKASDGSIGDEAHQGTDSDHNPEDDGPGGNPEDQVDARDFTHDPKHNADMGVVSESIRLSKDRRVSYVIFNRRIFSGALGPSPWVWRTYSGDNPHDKHMHVSVRDDTHDQTQDWQIGIDMAECLTKDSKDFVRLTRRVKAIEQLTDPIDLDEGPDTEPNKLAQLLKGLVADVADIKAILASGVPIPGEVNLTQTSVDQVAEATVDKLDARLDQ